MKKLVLILAVMMAVSGTAFAMGKWFKNEGSTTNVSVSTPQTGAIRGGQAFQDCMGKISTETCKQYLGITSEYSKCYTAEKIKCDKLYVGL